MYDGRVRPRYTGKERDAETGFANGNDYFGARYYSSSTGRFLSPDWSAQAEPVPYAQMDDPQSLNLYAYVRNNPLAGVDADGHQEPVPQAPPVARVPEEGKEGRPESETDPESDEALFARTREAIRSGEIARNEGAFEEFKKTHEDGYDDPNGVSHVGPPTKQQFEEMQEENRDRLLPALRRPYIRRGTRVAVENAAERDASGRPIDPNTRKPIEGRPDLGHKPGEEFRKAKADAEAKGHTQKQFNNSQNDPTKYQLEDPSSNRSRKHEQQ